MLTRPESPRVEYESSNGVTETWIAAVREAASESSVSSILDVGGGANPILPASYNDAEYVLLDIDQQELAKAPDNYRKLVADFSSPTALGERFNLIVSHSVCEHVHDPAAFHQNVFAHLRPGGKAMHFFPTLYAPPFVVNRILHERAASAVLHRLQAGREQHGSLGKFPAYYHWCRGPSRGQLKRFTDAGFEVETFVASFGHSTYYARWPIIKRLEGRVSGALVRHPIPLLTSYASRHAPPPRLARRGFSVRRSSRAASSDDAEHFNSSRVYLDEFAAAAGASLPPGALD